MTSHSCKILVVFVIILVMMLVAACQASSPTEPSNEGATPLREAETPSRVSVTATSTPTTTVIETAVAAPTVNARPADPEFSSLDIDWTDRTVFQQGLIAAEQTVLDSLPGATVYQLDLEIADNLLRVTGREDVRYTNREGEPLHEIYFRLFPNNAGGKLTLSAAKVDGQEIEPVYEFENTALRVPLPTALPPGETVGIQLDFMVDVAQEMAGNYGLFGYFDDVLVLDEFYPTIPVYDDEGWNVESPPPNADLSHNDASFYLVRVIAPAEQTVVAAGVEVDRKSEGDKQILTFVAGPARDFYLAASNNYTVISETVGETTINSYAFPEQREHAELALAIAADALRSFDKRFGPYPYTEFDVLSTPMQALGIEYPGIVGISLALYDPQGEVTGVPSPIMIEGTVAHEAAHQWFYNTVGNDQVDEPWLDEALAQYATWLYYVDAYGEGAAEGYRRSWENRWERVNRADIPIGLPAGDYQGREYGAIVYGRAPLFIAALAEEMGQETFDAFLRDYYQTHKWGIGTTETFQQLAEQYCQCDLTDLFEEWVYRK